MSSTNKAKKPNFTVVEFKEMVEVTAGEFRSFAVVYASWLQPNNTMTLWPPKHSNASNCALKKTEPSDSWALKTILKIHGENGKKYIAKKNVKAGLDLLNLVVRSFNYAEIWCGV